MNLRHPSVLATQKSLKPAHCSGLPTGKKTRYQPYTTLSRKITQISSLKVKSHQILDHISGLKNYVRSFCRTACGFYIFTWSWQGFQNPLVATCTEFRQPWYGQISTDFFFIVCSGFRNTIHVAYSGFRKSFSEAPAAFEILFNQQEMSMAPAAVGKTGIIGELVSKISI